MLADNAAKTRSVLGLEANGRCSLKFLDTEGALRNVVGLDETSTPALMFLDKQGTVLFKAP